MTGALVPDLLLSGVRRTPGKTCLVQDDASLTFAEVHDRAGRAVSAMRALGIEPGDRVALLAANELEFLELQIACQRLGAAFVPVNFRLARPEIESLVTDCRPALMVHGPGYAAAVDGLDIPHVMHLGADGAGTGYEEALDAHAAGPANEISMLPADSIAQITYTSGTTGPPKGAVVRNSAMFGRVSALMATLRIGRDDIFLQTLPLFHLASAVSFTFTAVGATCVTLPAFDPSQALRAIDQHRITHTLVVPTIIDALIRAIPGFEGDLRSLRMACYGASPIPAALLTKTLETLPCGLAQLYGMTEAGIAVMLPPEDHDPKTKPGLMRAAGRDVLFYRTRVVRPDGTSCAPGELGEITIAGPGLFGGYWNAPEATGQALRGGQMHTGDGGYVDEAGYLFLTDRIKDIIITGGENVYCPEVEAVLMAHPAVAEVAVIGLPDETWGQRVHAVLVPAAGPNATRDELDAWCRERLAGYKRQREPPQSGSRPASRLLPHWALGAAQVPGPAGPVQWFCGHCGDVYPAQVRQHQPHAVTGRTPAAARREHGRHAIADPAREALCRADGFGAGAQHVKVRPAVCSRHRAASGPVRPQVSGPGILGGQHGQHGQQPLLPAIIRER